MESDLGEVRQDINKVLQMINDKAEWLLQSATISTAEWRTHARSNSETKESYSSTLNKFCKSDLSQIKVFTGAFFCWVPSAHSFRVSLLLTIELRANSVNRFGTDIVLTSLLCLRYLLPPITAVQMQNARPSRNASPNLRSSSEEVRRR